MIIPAVVLQRTVSELMDEEQYFSERLKGKGVAPPCLPE